MTAIDKADVIRRAVILRTPFSDPELSLLSRVHRAAFRVRRRLSKRFVGKPAKRLFKLLLRPRLVVRHHPFAEVGLQHGLG